MFGDDLLVAPVLEPDFTAWTVYLPGKETWVSCETDVADRVAKCQGYGRYISVKSLKTWGKIFESHKKMAKNWIKMAKNG